MHPCLKSEGACRPISWLAAPACLATLLAKHQHGTPLQQTNMFVPASSHPVQQPGCLLQAFKGIGLPGVLSPLSDDKRSSSATGNRVTPRRDSSKGESVLSSSPSMQFPEQHIAPAPSGITRTGGWGLDTSQFGTIFGDRDGVEDGAEPTSSGGFSNPSPAHSADFARCTATAVC